jgi:hypothetical protein
MTDKARTITKQQSLQVEGLLALARRHKDIVNECEESLKEILEPDEEYGHSGDAIWADYPAKTLINKTNCTVVK